MKIPAFCKDMLGLLYPQLCAGCGNERNHPDLPVCAICFSDLPRTGFAPFEDNPVERIFSGRIRLQAAHSEFYFTRNPIIRNLIHQLKYKGSAESGLFLGRMLGESLQMSGRFKDVDLIIPLPLYPDRLHKRGYNQSEVIARGMTESFPAKLNDRAVVRNRNTETQTKKHRTERWVNVKEGFSLENPECMEGKHILLVDDVITTGATLEACGSIILSVAGTRLSIASLAMASK